MRPRFERERQGEAELAAATHLARHGELARHQRHQAPRDREAESRPAVAARHRRVRLGELLKDGAQLVFRDTDPRVPHAELYGRTVAVALNDARRHVDLALLRELDGVPDQIHEYLAQARGIAAHHLRHVGRHVHRQLEVFLAGSDREQRGGGMHDLGQVERDRLELEVLRFDLRVVQDVVEDGEQRLGRRAHQLQGSPLLRGQLRVQYQLDEAQDSVHGRADLMAHVSEERAARASDTLRQVARLAHGRFRGFAIADVLVQRDQRAVRGGMHRGRREADLDVSPVLAHALDFHAHDLTTPDARLQVARLGAERLRHDQPVNAGADDLIRGVAEQALERRIHAAHGALIVQHGDGYRRARDQRIEVGVLARQFLRRSLQQGCRPDTLGERAVGTPVHSVHPPHEHRDQDDGQEMRPGVALQQDADGERGEDGDQEVVKAAPVADQRAGRAGHDSGHHHEDECRLVEAQRRDRRSRSEPPRQANAGHGQAHAPQGLVGGKAAPSGAHPPPGSQPGGGRDRSNPSDRDLDRQGVPYQRGDHTDEQDVQGLGERAARQELTDRRAFHLGFDARLLVGGQSRRISRHHSICGNHGRLRNMARRGRRE